MTTTRRLGTTIFDDADPLDDLRPSKARKVIPLPDETRAAPQVVAPILAPPDAQAAAMSSADPLTLQEKTGLNGHEDNVEVDEPKGLPEKRKPNADSQGKSPRKVRFSANISVSTKERADNAAYWIPGLNLSALTEMALEREIRKLEKDFNAGEPFGPAGTLKFGRPRG